MKQSSYMMLGKVFLMISFMLLNIVPAQAALGSEFITENLKYKVLSDSAKTVEVSDVYKESGNIVIPSTVERAVKKSNITYSVVKIGRNAFRNCSNVTSITIPASITAIGDSVTTVKEFVICNSLTNISVSPDNPSYSSKDGVLFDKNQTVLIRYPQRRVEKSYVIPSTVTKINDYAFYKCERLTSITIPGSVTKIEDYAFSGCSSLTSITIPDNVTTIGTAAFYGCSSLTSITIPDNVIEIGGNAFSRCDKIPSILFSRGKKTLIRYSPSDKTASYIIPDTVTAIASCAFSECDYLSSITIPDTVTMIGGAAFYGCSSLTSITIPDSVTTIGFNTFGQCVSLTSITIPDSVTTIGDSAFNGCSSLTSITIPDSVTEIGENAFMDCDSLKNISVSSNNPNYSNNDGVLFDKDQTVLICYPAGKQGKSYIIPSLVAKIGDYAFDQCVNLTSITIPDSVTEIGEFAFRNCRSLTSITFPAGVIKIGNIFLGCRNLTSVYYNGDVPAGNVFYLSTAETLTSYYPKGNSSWKKAIQNGKWQGRKAVEWDPKNLRQRRQSKR